MLSARADRANTVFRISIRIGFSSKSKITFGFSISSWFSPKTKILLNSSKSSFWFLKFISGDILLVFFDVVIEYSTHVLKSIHHRFCLFYKFYKRESCSSVDSEEFGPEALVDSGVAHRKDNFEVKTGWKRHIEGGSIKRGFAR